MKTWVQGQSEPVEVGDLVRFKAACREGAPTVTRKVNGFYLGQPTVRYRGYADFVVRPSEILSVERTGQ